MIHAHRKNSKSTLCGLVSDRIRKVGYDGAKDVSCRNCKKTHLFKTWVKHIGLFRALTDDYYPKVRAHVTGKIKIHRGAFGLMTVNTLLTNVVNIKNGEVLADHLWVEDRIIQIKYNKGKDVIFSAVKMTYRNRNKKKHTLKVKNVKKYVSV